MTTNIYLWSFCSIYKENNYGRTGDVGETNYDLNITFDNTFHARNRRKS